MGQVDIKVIHVCIHLNTPALHDKCCIVQYQVGNDVLTVFSTPAESFAKTIMQTTGVLDYDSIFKEAPLLYTPMAYILFILFVVLMPILFSTLLVRSV